MRTKFKNANEAYEYFHNEIIINGVDFDNTKALFNVGFTLENPMDNAIHNAERKFNIKYAESEFKWYMSGDPSIDKLGEIYGKVPPIWERMACEYRMVNSNYGYQWQRNNQIGYVAKMLTENPNTRQAAISIYDGKEHNKYSKDTPCTYAIQFTVLNNKLNMSVYMRSNDLWYGFCIDQYCFSHLQNLMSKMTGYEVGNYYHHAHNLHLYNDKIK
jgi:thymidylate synthase